jgi:hypothetical protein
MSMFFAWIDLLYMAAGGAIVWHYKDTFVRWGRKAVAWWKGAASYADVLEAKAKDLLARAEAIKSAVIK